MPPTNFIYAEQYSVYEWNLVYKDNSVNMKIRVCRAFLGLSGFLNFKPNEFPIEKFGYGLFLGLDELVKGEIL
jgi:hypothetical protein